MMVAVGPSPFAATALLYLSSISIVRGTLVASTIVPILEKSPILDTLRVHMSHGDAAAVNAQIAWMTISLRTSRVLRRTSRRWSSCGDGAFDRRRLVAW
jgi:hypothetical protein